MSESPEEQFAAALAHHRAGQLVEADRAYRELLQRHPNNPDLLHNLGLVQLQRGDAPAALELIAQAISLSPTSAVFHFNLGNAQRNLSQWPEALQSYDRALQLDEKFAQAHQARANVLERLGRTEEALAAYGTAIRLRPDYAVAHDNRARLLQSQNRFAETITQIRAAISQCGPNFDRWMCLGDALADSYSCEDASHAYRQAIELDATSAEAFSRLGNVLRDCGDLDGAIAAQTRAIELKPELFEAHINQGNALKDQARLDESIAAFRAGLAIRCPAHAHSNLLYTLHFHPDYGGEAILREHREYARLHEEPLRAEQRPHLNDRAPGRRLKIAYVSPDLRDHAVGRFMLPLLRWHDRKQFDITCYSGALQEDEVSARLRQHTDAWHRVGSASDESLAGMIREHRIDILIDLSLHMARNRMLTFARKPAPVQVTYLGYASTTGLSSMDYRLSDWHLDPSGTDAMYSEKTIRLGKSYWCYDEPANAPEIAPLPALQHGHVTFGCLNHFSKVSAVAISAWRQILSAVPDSHLIVHAKQGSHRARFIETFEAAGVSRERIEFVPLQSFSDYLNTYNRIDIAMDPFPYAGGTTTCDALWMGVPVVTYRGQTAVARGGASILSHITASDLIADSVEAYIENARRLAADRTRLIEFRQTLRDKLRRSPLMDGGGFARDFETALRQMWIDWCAT